ncbi:zinc finger BED domain-containing protein RICESLEEPER 4-like [Actinidia eriantha]|uniref:zinc finger BED domain-containing protein RICESLEEPER 4-like n=1 Tax=Actinidia eriantha TaxID=165200 RepID=UPI00258AAD15|nr:zinc finger BED domain-containing protein RICESLEEPER 4-like [Actinidia eriantha]
MLQGSKNQSPRCDYPIMDANAISHGQGTAQAVGKDMIGTQVAEQDTAQAEVNSKRCRKNNTGKPPKPHNDNAVEKCSERVPSRAWTHFNKLESENSTRKAECKYCKKVYVADSKFHGTSNLLSHAATCAKNPYTAEVNGQKILGFQPKKDGEEGVELVSVSFSVEAARKALAEMIVTDELSFRFVEGVGFRRFCGVLQPKFKTIPSRTTITRDIVGIFNREKHKLKKALRGLRVCLTTDTWTSI